MKKFVHLYEDVIKWDDSAGEEAFSNAKKRFWAEVNGFNCDISLPNPDLYIDKIDWDSESDPDLELEPLNSNGNEDHDPVVIFGDSLFPNSVAGWGDDDENFKVPTNSSSGNHPPPFVENWGNSFDNSGATVGWPSYYNNPWQFSDGNQPSGYMAWGDGWNNEWGWNYSNNNVIYEVQNDVGRTMDDQGLGNWNENDKPPRVEGNESFKNQGNGGRKAPYWGEQPTSREWNAYNSCAITVGQTWNQHNSIR